MIGCKHAALDPLGGDEGNPVHRIAAAADHRAQRRMLQSRQPAERDVVSRLLVFLQTTALRAEREEATHRHRLPGFRVQWRGTPHPKHPDG